jgi:hypothetical protein
LQKPNHKEHRDGANGGNRQDGSRAKIDANSTCWTLQHLPDTFQQHQGCRCIKFFVGQTVEYTPVGEKTAGLYKIVRQMPKKEQAFDLKYLIKSEAEAYERNVLECQLSSDVRAESDYAMTKPRRRSTIQAAEFARKRRSEPALITGALR